MKLLLDQNLSRRLVDHLRDAFPDSTHVIDLALDASTDQEIWTYAGEHGLIIVSKDSDFRQLAFLHGCPPKAIWLRVGNASTTAVLEVLLDNIEQIEDFAEDDAAALLVLTPEGDGRTG